MYRGCSCRGGKRRNFGCVQPGSQGGKTGRASPGIKCIFPAKVMGSSPGISYTLSRGGGSGFLVDRTPHSYAPRLGTAEPPRASQHPPRWPRRQRHANLLSRPPPGRRHLPARKACWERKGPTDKAVYTSGRSFNQSPPGNSCLAPPRRLSTFFHRWNPAHLPRVGVKPARSLPEGKRRRVGEWLW